MAFEDAETRYETIDPALLDINNHFSHLSRDDEPFERPCSSWLADPASLMNFADSPKLDDLLKDIENVLDIPSIVLPVADPIDNMAEASNAWPHCPSDPIARYGRLMARITFDPDSADVTILPKQHQVEIREIYNSGYAYGLAMCDQVYPDFNFQRVLSNRILSESIAFGANWLRRFRQEHNAKAQDFPTQQAYFLDRLEALVSTLAELRIHCLLVHGFDVTESPHQPPFATRDTSDSCDSNEDKESLYEIVRADLEAFQRNDSLEWLQVPHDGDKRLRRDIRAWARLARYGCTKLSGGTMLLHKHKDQVPRRRRQPPQYTEHLTKRRRKENNRNGSNSSANSSGDSGDSTHSKKKRMPATRGGYPCEHCGKVFDRYCDRNHHMRSHQDKTDLPHACAECGERFTYPKDLRRHFRRKHADKCNPQKPLGHLADFHEDGYETDPFAGSVASHSLARLEWFKQHLAGYESR